MGWESLGGPHRKFAWGPMKSMGGPAKLPYWILIRALNKSYRILLMCDNWWVISGRHSKFRVVGYKKVSYVFFSIKNVCVWWNVSVAWIFEIQSAYLENLTPSDQTLLVPLPSNTFLIIIPSLSWSFQMAILKDVLNRRSVCITCFLSPNLMRSSYI
jgi:hypothetical protein